MKAMMLWSGRAPHKSIQMMLKGYLLKVPQYMHWKYTKHRLREYTFSCSLPINPRCSAKVGPMLSDCVPTSGEFIRVCWPTITPHS